MARTKLESFLISIAKKVEVKNLTDDKNWKETYESDIAELLERAGFDYESAIEEDYSSDDNSIFFFFLTDEYKTVQENEFRGYLIPEKSVICLGKDFVKQAKDSWDCDIFSEGDEVKVSVAVVNDKSSSIDYYLRAFEEDGEPVVIELSEDSLVDPDAIKEGAYYGDKIITGPDGAEDIPDSLLDEGLNALYLD